MTVRATNDTYRSSGGNNAHEGENRMKLQATKVAPLDFKEENKMLLKRLAIYEQKSQNMMAMD